MRKKKFFLGLHTTQVWHKNIVWILSHLLIRNVLQVLPASCPLCPFPSPLSLMIVQTDCQNRANVDRDGHKASFYLTLLGLGVPPPRPAAPPSNWNAFFAPFSFLLRCLLVPARCLPTCQLLAQAGSRAGWGLDYWEPAWVESILPLNFIPPSSSTISNQPILIRL